MWGAHCLTWHFTPVYGISSRLSTLTKSKDCIYVQRWCQDTYLKPDDQCLNYLSICPPSDIIRYKSYWTVARLLFVFGFPQQRVDVVRPSKACPLLSPAGPVQVLLRSGAGVPQLWLTQSSRSHPGLCGLYMKAARHMYALCKQCVCVGLHTRVHTCSFFLSWCGWDEVAEFVQW